MPEVQEVFRMATQKVKPDPGAMERQFRGQRRRTTRRKAGVYGLVAALVIAAAVVAANFIPEEEPGTPGTRPSTVTPVVPGAQVVGTVTFDGSTCSVEITADRIEPGFVVLDVVNASDQRVMFDSWHILEGYTFRAFDTAVERVRRLAEAGKPYPSKGPFPDQETEVRYLGSDVIPANSSEIIVTRMSSPGTHAIVCMRRFEGAHRSLRGFQPSGIAGPIVVR